MKGCRLRQSVAVAPTDYKEVADVVRSPKLGSVLNPFWNQLWRCAVPRHSKIEASMSLMGQSLPKSDTYGRSAFRLMADIKTQHAERREGPRGRHALFYRPLKVE